MGFTSSQKAALNEFSKSHQATIFTVQNNYAAFFFDDDIQGSSEKYRALLKIIGGPLENCQCITLSEQFLKVYSVANLVESSLFENVYQVALIEKFNAFQPDPDWHYLTGLSLSFINRALYIIEEEPQHTHAFRPNSILHDLTDFFVNKAQSIIKRALNVIK